MHVLESIHRHKLAAIVTGVAMASVPLGAQSGAKVLTPPRPADTAARTPPANRPAAPGTAVPAPGTTSAARPAPVIPQSAVLDSIREVVFHSLLEKDRAGFATLASAFCLSLSTDDFKKKVSTSPDRADPPESMVRRLATTRTPARRASTCTFSPNAAGRSIPGRPLLYSVGAIDLSAGDRAEAAAGYNYDGYSSAGYTFSVERSDSGWVVKQWRMEWTARANTP
jgi:hypothetical protein